MPYASTAAIAPIQVLSDQLRLLLRSADSPSQMSAMVVDVPPGGFVPPHRHAREEEGYFVLEGLLALTIADQTRTLSAGDFGHVPPRTVHAYANPGPAPVRFLAWTVGGPIDQFFEAMHQHVKKMPEDAPAMAEITARFGVQMVGAPA
jgi:quercetin dioxygenase-like cupin family protein